MRGSRPCPLLLVLVPLARANIQYPQGYYPFEESPARIPPIVRRGDTARHRRQ